MDLAAAENIPGDIHAWPEDLSAALFAPRAVAEAVLAEVDGSW